MDKTWLIFAPMAPMRRGRRARCKGFEVFSVKTLALGSAISPLKPLQGKGFEVTEYTLIKSEVP